MKWIAVACFGLGLLGWSAIAIAAVAFAGGHPPLSAYLTVPVMVVLLPINFIGFALGMRSLRRDADGETRTLHRIGAPGNAALLVLNGAVWLRFLI